MHLTEEGKKKIENTVALGNYVTIHSILFSSHLPPAAAAAAAGAAQLTLSHFNELVFIQSELCIQ